MQFFPKCLMGHKKISAELFWLKKCLAAICLSVSPPVWCKPFTFPTSSEPLHARPATKLTKSCSFRGSDEMYFFEAIRRLRYFSPELSRNVSLEVLKKGCFSEPFEILHGRSGLWLAEISDLIFPNYFLNHQTCQKYSSQGSEDVLLVFGVIQPPRWLP